LPKLFARRRRGHLRPLRCRCCSRHVPAGSRLPSKTEPRARRRPS